MENENAFKNLVNEKVVRSFARLIQKVEPSFKSSSFLKLIPNLSELELKARVSLIAEYLNKNLVSSYPENLTVLRKVIAFRELKGFELWPISEYISQFGLNHYEESLEAMYELTQQFTAEFAVRPFLIKDYKKVFKYLSRHVKDENVHIRRWISEGTRPLLPWGQKIHLFEKDPSLTTKFLEALKYDDELYVRKSIANHLNDLSKNNPNYVISTLENWLKEAPEIHQDKIKWITKHALRTLIKKGDLSALKLIGIKGSAQVEIESLKLSKKKYILNDTLNLSFTLHSTAKTKQLIVVDYIISFLKKDGKYGKKVFKLKTFEILPRQSILMTKNHSLRLITTMKYYSGLHTIGIQINGKNLSQVSFDFKI